MSQVAVELLAAVSEEGITDCRNRILRPKRSLLSRLVTSRQKLFSFEIGGRIHDLLDAVKHFSRISLALVSLLWRISIGSLAYTLRHPVHVALTVAVSVFLWVAVLTSAKLNQQVLLSQISQDLVSEILSFSRFNRDFDAEQVDKSGSRELVRVGGPQWAQQEAVRAVLFEARKEGLSIEDQAALLATVEVESGFNPFARAATTSACGLFQFVRETGTRYDLSTQTCLNPWQNARAGVRHFKDTLLPKIESNTARLVGAEKVFRTFELSYYLHHDGPNSADPSNDLKALVLDSSHFLFKSYHALEREKEFASRAPSLLDRFAKSFSEITDTVNSLTQRVGLPLTFSEAVAESGEGNLTTDLPSSAPLVVANPKPSIPKP